ncbi:MAG: hypothetical protein ACLFM4_05685 [Phormidium sp.]
MPSHRDFAINPVSIVVIDLETGDFEVDASEIAACDRLEATHPDAQIWIVRIGLGYVRRFGGRAKRKEAESGREVVNLSHQLGLKTRWSQPSLEGEREETYPPR